MRRHKLKLVLRYHHLQTLCPWLFWPLGNSLTSLAIEFVRPFEPVSVNCPSEPEKLQINEAIEATKLEPHSQDGMEQQTVSKDTYKFSLEALSMKECDG